MTKEQAEKQAMQEIPFSWKTLFEDATARERRVAELLAQAPELSANEQALLEQFRVEIPKHSLSWVVDGIFEMRRAIESGEALQHGSAALAAALLALYEARREELTR